jgi:hypothetical protein
MEGEHGEHRESETPGSFGEIRGKTRGVNLKFEISDLKKPSLAGGQD